MLKLIIGLLLVLSSCSHFQKNDGNNLNKECSGDLVSLSTALDLAKQSYIRGCQDHYSLGEGPKRYQHCLNKANEHMEKNINSFLKGEPVTIVEESSYVEEPSQIEMNLNLRLAIKNSLIRRKDKRDIVFDKFIKNFKLLVESTQRLIFDNYGCSPDENLEDLKLTLKVVRKLSKSSIVEFKVNDSNDSYIFKTTCPKGTKIVAQNDRPIIIEGFGKAITDKTVVGFDVDFIETGKEIIPTPKKIKVQMNILENSLDLKVLNEGDSAFSAL